MTDYLKKHIEPLERKLSAKILIFKDGVEIFPANGSGVVPKGVFEAESDFSQGFVFFPFSVGDCKMVGAISGTGAEREVTALVLAALLEKKDMHAASQEDKLRKLILNEAEFSTYFEVSNALNGNNYHIFALSCEKSDRAEVLDFLLQFSESGDIAIGIDPITIAFLKKIDDAGDYGSSREYASLLSESIVQELSKKVIIGIGGSDGIGGANEAFSRAAAALRLGELTGFSGNIFSYKELAVLKILEDVPHEKLCGCFDILADKSTLDILSDEDLMSTAREFLANSLNISETARTSFMHRNTLIYRLDKIEKATGLNIRSFNDASIFRMISMIYKKLKDN